MPTFLVVKVTDVNNNPLKGCTVTVQFGGPNQTAPPAGPDGIFEVPIPDTADIFTVTVENSPQFFVATQTVKIVRGSGSQSPSLIFSGNVQELNTLRVGGHSRDGGGFSLELYFALGQLRNARSEVELVKVGAKISTIDAGSMPVLDFNGLTVLDVGGKGWKQFIHQPIPSVVPAGRMLYAARVDTPKLIGIWVPAGVTATRQRDNTDPSKKPLNFHVFYHPSPGVLKGRYPFSFAFVDLIVRYLLLFRVKHKGMVAQQTAAGAKTVLVFPVGDPAGWYGSYGGQASVLRLLQEVAFFVQRLHGIPIPLQPVGKCAVSGFSAGGQFVHQALLPQSDFFDKKVLREVYGFDIRGVSPSTFAQSLKAWRDRNAGLDSDPRKFRLYTTDGSWFDANQNIDPTTNSVVGPAGGQERSGANTTIVLVPTFSFWPALNPAKTGDGLDAPPSSYQIFAPVFDDVHQMMPALFQEHALRNSQFV
jgi:hypothetical protein